MPGKGGEEEKKGKEKRRRKGKEKREEKKRKGEETTRRRRSEEEEECEQSRIPICQSQYNGYGAQMSGAGLSHTALSLRSLSTRPCVPTC
eukprot:scaffold118266_cov48-Phaeocystis_antarctica.AAC.1